MILRIIRHGLFKILAECDDDYQCELLSFFEDHLRGNLSRNAIHMLNLLDRVSKAGPPRNVEISHQIDGPIFQFEKGRLRLLWFYDRDRVIVCSHGFVKESGKTMKTPKRHKDRASALYRRYHEDKDKGKITIIKEESNE